jgi:hypothetical protein
MSELKEDELTKSVCYLLVNKKWHEGWKWFVWKISDS